MVDAVLTIHQVVEVHTDARATRVTVYIHHGRGLVIIDLPENGARELLRALQDAVTEKAGAR